MATSIATRTVQQAASLVGGPRKLRGLLGVRAHALMSWLSGAAEPPRDVLLRALDLILDDLDEQERQCGRGR